MKYHLCAGDNQKFFIDEVNRYLSNGWVPNGETIVSNGWFYQAVIFNPHHAEEPK